MHHKTRYLFEYKKTNIQYIHTKCFPKYFYTTLAFDSWPQEGCVCVYLGVHVDHHMVLI